MNLESSNCPRCEGELGQVARVGALETRRCDQCGFEQHVLVSFVGEPNGIGVDEPSVLLVVWWRNVPPAAVEVRAVRKAFPELAAISLGEFLKKACESPRFVIGALPKAQATDTINRLLDTGLDLRIEE